MRTATYWLAGCLFMGGIGSTLPAAESGTFDNDKAKLSYALGMNLGQQFRRDEMDLDLSAMLDGLRDAMADARMRLTEEEMRVVLQAEWDATRTRRAEKRRQLGEENRAEAEKFLAENRTRPGVVTLPSGLQYRVISEGTGSSPSTNSVVTVHYRGRLIDGTEFDSSHSRGQPAEFSLNRVIRGWGEGMQLMKPGAKYELFIPAPLAYGEAGQGAKIGPNALLIFEIELISFTTPEPSATPASTPQAVTSDIIKVPSKEEMDKGAKIEVIKKEDVERMLQEQQKKEAPPQ
jgi:FKBP-type peptidyl-prolyl cis-trans isomerase FklB